MLETLINVIKEIFLSTAVSILVIVAAAKYTFPETFRTIDIIARNNVRSIMPSKYLSYTDRVKRVISKVF